MNDRVATLCVAEMSAEVADERIDPDALDGLAVAMQSIELAASLGVAKILPVGGLVTGACEARFLDEGFQQDRTVRITGMPVVRQALADQGERARGEVTTLYPGQDEESRVVDDEVQVARTLLARPANELIARLGLPGAGTEAHQGNDLIRGAHEVAQLRSGHELMTEVMMALDVRIPEQGVALCPHQIDAEPSQIHRGHGCGFKYSALDVRMRPITHGPGVSRRRQRDEAVSLHPQQRHTAAHILEPAVSSAPVQPLTHFTGEPGAIERRGPADQCANELDLRRRKATAAVTHRSARIDQAQGLLMSAKDEYVLVQPHPPAPQYGHAGLAVALAPQVTADAANHAYHFAQARRLGRRQLLIEVHVQRFDLLWGEHVGGREVRLHTCQVGDVHQPHPDDAEEGQIASEAFGGLEQTVLDLAARLEHLVPGLNAPAFPIPLDLLGCGLEVFDRQVRQQHPADRSLPLRRGALGGSNHVYADRLRRTRCLGVAASLRRLDRGLRHAHANIRLPSLALAVAGNLHRQGAEHFGAGERFQKALEACALFGHEQSIGARTDEETRALLLRLREKFEEVRFPIGHRDDLNAARGALQRLAQRLKPLGAFLLLDRCALQPLDLLLIAFLRNRLARPDVLTQQTQRHARGRKGQRVMHDQPALVLAIAAADRPQTSGLRMLAIGEEHRVLDGQHRSAHGSHAFDCGLDMRRENDFRARITVVKQTIRGSVSYTHLRGP